MLKRTLAFTAFTAFTACSTFLAPGALAADSALAPPRPLELADPIFSRPEREALVVLRYAVKADGSTADVEVVEGFTNGLFDEAAVSTVEGWRFEPGTNGGEAVDFLNQVHVLAFRPAGVGAISPQVVSAYAEISPQLEAKEFQAVASRLEGMLENGINTVFDYAFLNDVLATTYVGLGQNARALEAARRATLRISPMSPGAEPADILTRELLEGALRKRFALAASFNQAQDAVQTFERLDAMGSDSAAALRDEAEALQARLDSSEPLGMIAAIDNGRWRYTPARRIIAVTEVTSGKIDSLDIRCQRRSLQLAFEAGVEWNLPAVLGECELEFVGEPGTQFTLYEFAE